MKSKNNGLKWHHHVENFLYDFRQEAKVWTTPAIFLTFQAIVYEVFPEQVSLLIFLNVLTFILCISCLIGRRKTIRIEEGCSNDENQG